MRHKNATHKSALTTKQLVYSAVAIALAVVCSMIKLFDMPMGGSVTLLSMLFIVLIAYWYGPYVGIMTAVAYGLVQFVLEPIFYTIPQMLLDYPLAFGALGLAGFFNKKKWGLQIGYIVGVIGRFVFATISGVVPPPPPICTLKRDMFYYKNIGEYEVSRMQPEAAIL